MTPAERKYGTGEQKLLAIVMAYKQWRYYLEGSKHPIELLTDHANLVIFMTIKTLTGRQAKMVGDSLRLPPEDNPHPGEIEPG